MPGIATGYQPSASGSTGGVVAQVRFSWELRVSKMPMDLEALVAREERRVGING